MGASPGPGLAPASQRAAVRPIFRSPGCPGGPRLSLRCPMHPLPIRIPGSLLTLTEMEIVLASTTWCSSRSGRAGLGGQARAHPPDRIALGCDPHRPAVHAFLADGADRSALRGVWKRDLRPGPDPDRGGLFLVGKSAHEITRSSKGRMPGKARRAQARRPSPPCWRRSSSGRGLSLDSVITAVGMARDLWVMINPMIRAWRDAGVRGKDRRLRRPASDVKILRWRSCC